MLTQYQYLEIIQLMYQKNIQTKSMHHYSEIIHSNIFQKKSNFSTLPHFK